MPLHFHSFADEMLKIAEEAVAVPEQPAAEHPIMPYVRGVGGFALGTGLGYAGMEALNRYALHGQAAAPVWLQRSIPLATGFAGMAMSGLQAHMLDKARKNWAARHPEEAGVSENT